MGSIERRPVDRRGFLKRVGAAGALGGAAVLGGREILAAQTHPPGHAEGHSVSHGHGAVGTVDHARNGFHPLDMLTDFDGGVVSKDSSGRTVREYELVTVDKEIEVAPGI